jgi:hypothetical protein
MSPERPGKKHNNNVNSGNVGEEDDQGRTPLALAEAIVGGAVTEALAGLAHGEE